MDFILPEFINTALMRLEADGHAAYVVGGAVRDRLMGLEPHDFDIATDAVPSDVARIFAGFTVAETGLRHGTLTIVMGGKPVEITTFRRDGGYADCRHPESVTFTKSLADDLARRDFTVNAMAYSPRAGLVDLFGGADDIRHRVIRAVGDAESRISEDALRILRALRFSSRTGFTIEDVTAAAVHSKKELLKNISAERILSEFKGILTGGGVLRVLRDFSDVICGIIPETEALIGFSQNTKYHMYDVYMHTLHALDESAPDVNVRLALFFHDFGKPQVHRAGNDGISHFFGHQKVSAAITKVILTRMRSDAETVRRVERLVLLHDKKFSEPPDVYDARRLIRDIGYADAKLLCEVQRGDILAHAVRYRDRANDMSRLSAMIDEIQVRGDCVNTSGLAVNGDDLISAGLAGRTIGDTLSRLLDMVIGDRLPNERDALLGAARKMNK